MVLYIGHKKNKTHMVTSFLPVLAPAPGFASPGQLLLEVLCPLPELDRWTAHAEMDGTIVIERGREREEGWREEGKMGGEGETETERGKRAGGGVERDRQTERERDSSFVGNFTYFQVLAFSISPGSWSPSTSVHKLPHSFFFLIKIIEVTMVSQVK